MQGFCHEHVVRFNEVDAASVAFFSRFFEWAHHTWEGLLALALAPDWFSRAAELGWGLPLVGASGRFRRPARLGDGLRITAWLLEHDARRLRVEFRVERADGIELARLEHEHAFVDLETFRPIDADPAIVARLLECGLRPVAEAGP